jgi:hypothetical protein
MRVPVGKSLRLDEDGYAFESLLFANFVSTLCMCKSLSALKNFTTRKRHFILLLLITVYYRYTAIAPNAFGILQHVTVGGPL